MKRLFFAFTLALVICGGFFAIGSEAAPEYTIKLSSIVSETHPDIVLMKEVFVPYIEGKSNGRIKVELYPNGQLGGDREITESVQMGTVQMALPATSAIAGFDKRFQVLDLPFLFTSRETALAAFDGELGQMLNSFLPDKGFVNLGFAENGFRHITNSKRPIKTPDDLKGIKLRTMENPMHIAFFKRLGANPTPMSFGELYTALQQGTVDGQENPATLIFETKFYEVQKHMSTSGHVFSAIMLLASKKFMDGLPDDLRKIVEEGAAEWIAAHRKLMPEVEAKNMLVLKEKGMEIYEMTPEDKMLFVEATGPVYDEFEANLTKEVMDMAKKYQK